MDDSLTADGMEGMERPAARPEPVRRQGETPKQQVRKAKHITRRHFTAEDKIRIVMEDIRGEESVSEICRRERLHTMVYYRFSSIAPLRRSSGGGRGNERVQTDAQHHWLYGALYRRAGPCQPFARAFVGRMSQK